MNATVRRKLAAGIATLAAVGIALTIATPAIAAPEEPAAPEESSQSTASDCQEVNVPVPTSVLDSQLVELPELGLGGALSGEDEFTIYGQLCLPAGQTPKTVMLALHGILFNNNYWNADYQPETYNFSEYMNKAGYAVFAIDRLGIGKSSKPLGALVTLDSGAEVAHRIIQKLRAGEIGQQAFERVILTGYSYGSGTSWRETAKYNDADAVLTTAWGSTMQPLPLVRFLPTFIPAQIDPKVSDRPLGYLSSPVGRDQNYFWDLSNVDPEVMKYTNETMYETITAGEIATFFPRYAGVPITNLPNSSEEIVLPLSDQTKHITKPTFLVNGTGELWFCGIDQQHCTSSQNLQKQESKNFSEGACFRAASIPNAGHNLNLQRNAQFTFETLRTFADQAVGPNGENVDSYRAGCSSISGPNVDTGPAQFGAVGSLD